jgi:transcriptional regulator with XRE-family HTH domain
MNRMNRTARQRKRLQILIEEMGTQARLASKVGTADAYISQLLNSRNGIARKFCEKLETATDKPDGWMDQWLPEETKTSASAAALPPKQHAPQIHDLIGQKAKRLDLSVQKALLFLIESAITASDPRAINLEAENHRKALERRKTPAGKS